MSQIRSSVLAYTPGIISGLFTGRLLSELWASWTGSTPLWLAAAFTLFAGAGWTWYLRRCRPSETWPVYFLLFYVLASEPSVTTAVLTALFVLLTWWQTAGIRLPLHGPAATYLIPILLLTSCFLLYLGTLAPDILPADNGEFQLAAANLGVAHPPGFPLYTVLAHLFTRLPFGDSPAYRANLFAAVTSTLTLAAVYAAVYVVSKRTLASAAAVMALATATTFWAQATTANIRSMTALFAALILLTAILFYRETRQKFSGAQNNHADRYLILLALALALGVTHHASLAFYGLMALLFVFIADPSLLRTPSRWWRPLLAFAAGLLPLLYLPLRAGSDVRGASAQLGTLPGFLGHTLALGFSGDLFVYLEPALFWERMKIMLNVLTFQFSPWLVFMMAAALLLLLWQDWRLAFLLGGGVLLFTLITATYRAPQTVEYMLPAYVSLAVLLGAGGGGLAGIRVMNQQRFLNTAQALLTAAIIVLSLGQFQARYESYRYLSGDRTARSYAERLLTDAPQEALLLANWHWATPLWYLQEVEGLRRDVEVRYVFPEGEPYAQTWVRRTAQGLADGRDVITTNFDADAFGALPVSEPLGDAFLFSQEARGQLPEGFSEIDLLLGGSMRLLGYPAG